MFIVHNFCYNYDVFIVCMQWNKKNEILKKKKPLNSNIKLHLPCLFLFSSLKWFDNDDKQQNYGIESKQTNAYFTLDAHYYLVFIYSLYDQCISFFSSFCDVPLKCICIVVIVENKSKSSLHVYVCMCELDV